MKQAPCRICLAESMVEATAVGYRVKCTVCPGEHYGPERKSRDRAIREWNAMQAGKRTDET